MINEINKLRNVLLIFKLYTNILMLRHNAQVHGT